MSKISPKLIGFICILIFCALAVIASPADTFTTLVDFDLKDGIDPGLVVQGTDGNFYGVTGGVVNHYWGTVFKITAEGTLTTLHNFNRTDANPGALVQATNRTLYGTAGEGGDLSCDSGYGSGCGTIFSLAVGLGPFVKTETTSGMVGAHVIILGNNLAGASSVTFNDKAASFKVVSSTEITTPYRAAQPAARSRLKRPAIH